MSQNLQIQLPVPAVPFVDARGVIARPWYYFLLQMFRLVNTGAGPTPPPIPEQLAGLELLIATESIPTLGVAPQAFPPFMQAPGDPASGQSSLVAALQQPLPTAPQRAFPPFTQPPADRSTAQSAVLMAQAIQVPT